MSNQSRSLLLASALVFTMAIVVLPRCSSGRGRTPIAPKSGAGLHGSIYTVATKAPFLLVPDFEVFLRNTSTGAISTHVRHFWTSSCLREIRTAMPATASTATVTHIRNTAREYR